MMERDHYKDRNIDRRLLLRRIIEKYDAVLRTGLIWLRIGTGGELLCTR
jgi:hypothetical protein